MRVLVCIKAEYVRDQQIYVGRKADDVHASGTELGWSDAFGSIVVVTKNAASIEVAIIEIANQYNCPIERFKGYQIME